MKTPHEITRESLNAFDKVDALRVRLAAAEKLAGAASYQDPDVLHLRTDLAEAERAAADTVNMEPL